MKPAISSLAVVSLALALTGSFVPPASAAGDPPPEQPEVSTSDLLPGEPELAGRPGEAFNGWKLDGDGGLALAVAGPVVGCTVVAAPPFTVTYNKPPIWAEGWINFCTKPSPEDCRIETDLEQYDKGARRWNVVANGPAKFGCNVGNKKKYKSMVSYKCAHDPRGAVRYRTRTYIITKYKGKWAPAASVATSGENSWWCV